MMARAVWGTFLSSRPLFSSSPSSLSTFSLVSNSPFSSLSSTRIAPTSCFSSLCGGSTSSFQPTTSFLGTNEKWNWFQARLLTTEDESTEENVEEEEENLAKKGEREKWLRQFRKTRKWDKTMDEEPDNRMTEEEMEAIKSKYLDHEIWHHPLREPLLSRPQKPDHLRFLDTLEKLRPDVYKPKDPLERERKNEYLRPAEDIIKYQTVLQMGRHTNVTKAGRVQTISALVMVGNGNGVAGFGYGTGNKARDAVDRAMKNAHRNLFSIQRYEDRTIADIKTSGYFNGVTVFMKQMPPGGGIRACTVVREMCRCFGVQDVTCKIYGSKNMRSVIRAVWKIFLRQRHPMHIARATGRRFFDRNRIWRDKMYSHAY